MDLPRLMKSHLTDRSKYVEVNGICSTTCPVSNGVPQGSVLGPLLFLIYVNDLNQVSDVLDCIQYADDMTFMYTPPKNQTCLQTAEVIKKDLDVVADWFHAKAFLPKRNISFFVSPMHEKQIQLF